MILCRMLIASPLRGYQNISKGFNTHEPPQYINYTRYTRNSWTQPRALRWL